MSAQGTAARVVAVSRDDAHNFSKPTAPDIRLVAGRGVEGDAHFGETVQHVHRLKRDPESPNLRQVHLMHSELFDELGERGFEVAPGELGENVTTEGIDLLGLPEGTRLRLGSDALIEITGLRNPCTQINGKERGLMKAVLGKDAEGNVIRKAGVMSIVVTGGTVRAGDPIEIELPAEPHRPLGVV
jgi:MOSC domain-containing protein YiiM